MVPATWKVLVVIAAWGCAPGIDREPAVLDVPEAQPTPAVVAGTETPTAKPVPSPYFASVAPGAVQPVKHEETPKLVPVPAPNLAPAPLEPVVTSDIFNDASLPVLR